MPLPIRPQDDVGEHIDENTALRDRLVGLADRLKHASQAQLTAVTADEVEPQLARLEKLCELLGPDESDPAATPELGAAEDDGTPTRVVSLDPCAHAAGRSAVAVWPPSDRHSLPSWAPPCRRVQWARAGPWKMITE